jgi:hypothetical protein
VTVDGERVPITPGVPHGRITFPVPAGRHRVSIRFGETPLRLTADFISLVCLVIVVGLALLSQKKRLTNDTPPSQQLSPAWAAWGLALVGLTLLLQHADNPLRHPGLRDGTLPGIQHPVNGRYADGLTLIGYEQSQASLPADGELRLDLYWTAYAHPGARYQSVLHLVGPDGLRWSLPDTRRPTDYDSHPPTATWQPGQYALDSQEITPLPGTPPGTYDIVLTTFDRYTLVPLSVLNAQGQPVAPELTLGRVTLTRPRRPAVLPEDGRLDFTFQYFDLATAEFDRDEAAPGDSVYLTMMWRANRDDDGAVSYYCGQSLILLAPDGSKAAGYTLPLPAPAWEKGDVWRSQHQLVLPAELETGTYTWTVEWCSPSADAIGQITITAPPHTFTPPTLPHTLDTILGETATLVGFDLAGDVQPGSTLTVTLVWRAEETPATSYRVFLHLLDSEGRLVAQSDGVPADWTRPTTGWLPGEIITDPRTLTIPPDAPPGAYTLQAGLYVPGGARLTAGGGSDAVRLATLTLDGR